MALFSGGLLQTPLPHTADQIHSSETVPTPTTGSRQGSEKKKKKEHTESFAQSGQYNLKYTAYQEDKSNNMLWRADRLPKIIMN